VKEWVGVRRSGREWASIYSAYSLMARSTGGKENYISEGTNGEALFGRGFLDRQRSSWTVRAMVGSTRHKFSIHTEPISPVRDDAAVLVDQAALSG